MKTRRGWKPAAKPKVKAFHNVIVAGLALVVLFNLNALSPLWALQAFTGHIVGTVRDTTGAVIPGVEITITHLQTNREVKAVTDDRGEYVSIPLDVGRYRVEATLPGFKRAVRTGITLEVQRTAVVDFTLEVGELADSVEVVGDAPLLEVTTSTLAKVVDNRRILDLPLNTRNVYSLVMLTPGFTGSVGHQYGDMNWSVYGSRPTTMDILIDGVTATHPGVTGFTAISIFPSVDAIQEFNVMGANLSAEYGRTQGSVLNVVYKSGTNDFHGSLYNFLRNSIFDANNFFANQRGEELASFKRNQFGGVLSGPIRRDKTFFMVSYEGLRERRFHTRVFSVPTLLEREGDFSQTFNRTGELVQLYDPFTTRAREDGPGFIRNPFPGNVIPPERFDPVAAQIMQYYPLPNQPGDPFTARNNYAKSGSFRLDMDNYDFRVDHHLSDTEKFFVRYSHRYTLDAPPVLFPEELAVAEGRINLVNRPRNFVFEYSNALSPTNVVTARLGLARSIFVYDNQGYGFRPSSLAFPEWMDDAADDRVFPRFTASGYVTLGHRDHRFSTFNTYTATTSLNQTRGAHNLKLGFEGRMIRTNVWEARAPSGDFPFAPAFTQGPDPLRASDSAGNSIASLLLGAGQPGARLFSKYKDVAAQSFYFAGYVQDDWRVSPRLTLNLGLRYDFDTPRTERYDRLNYFDPDVRSPLADLVPAFPDLRGGLIYVGVDGQGRHQYRWDMSNFAPRVGFAFRATPSTVIRGGYSHMYGASWRSASGTDTPFGFRGETVWVSTLDGITPFTLLSNPYPDGIEPPQGAAEGLLSGTGMEIRPQFRNEKTPWTQQWNLTVQRELPSEMLLELGYVGNRGRELSHRRYINDLEPQHLALGPQLNELVDNPFYGIVNRGVLVAPQVRRAQLLRPFPQFADMEGTRNIGGKSWYHAFQLTSRKRMSHGVQFEGSYVWSKTIDTGEMDRLQNSLDLSASRAIASTDIAHRFVLSYLYELPFGTGRTFGRDASGLLNSFIGGWQFNGIVNFQSGRPLGFTAANTAGAFNPTTYPNNDGRSGRLSGRAQDRLDGWFDRSVFSQPPPFTFGNMGPRSPDIRSHGVRNFDLSLFKEFYPAEALRVQFRVEALNAFNTVRFGNPNTSVTSGSFGRVTSQANAPRQIQFGLKMLW